MDVIVNGGSKRLRSWCVVVVMQYMAKRVSVREVMTHPEYDDWCKLYRQRKGSSCKKHKHNLGLVQDDLSGIIPHGIKLAYCPTDLRRLRFYRDELLALDDLFAVSTYSDDSPVQIGADPDRDGWICGSHFVILHRQTIHDTRNPNPIPFQDYPDVSRYVKRLFRVVPASHHRGL